MLRCANGVLWATLLLAFSLPAAAQMPRPFPASALRGEIVVVQPPEILLNGQPARLAPGARVRGPDNMLQMSGSLLNRRLVVHYTIDPDGLVMDAWILRPDELAKRPWPTTPAQAAAWQFDWAAQTWSRP